MNRSHLTLIHFKVTHVSGKMILNLGLLTANKMKPGFDARSQNMRLIKGDGRRADMEFYNLPSNVLEMFTYMPTAF